jgi:hypothetical protein
VQAPMSQNSEANLQQEIPFMKNRIYQEKNLNEQNKNFLKAADVPFCHLY